MTFKKILFVLLCTASSLGSFAQLNNNCPGCAVNMSQIPATADDFSVGLYPDTIILRQNSALSQDVTYLLPKQVNTGISIAPTATVTQVQILGINATSPLPSGISITCDQSASNCTYHPQTNRFGCVKVCGITSDAATNGFVQAKITVAGTGTAAGQTQTQNQDITVYYKILPDTTACHTVCFQNKINTGCDSATIGVYPGIDIACPNSILNPCVFNWDYGNGVTGTGLTSQSVAYTTPGAYPVTLQKKTQKLIIAGASFTVPNDPALLGVFPCVSGCSWYNNICNGFGVNNGANNFSLNFTIGSNTYSTGGAGGGSLQGSYTGLGFDVTDQAVAISVHDDCLLTDINTSIATLTINGPGVYNWSIGNDATGSLTIAQVDKDSATYSDTVHIYASPTAPVITASKDSLCNGDSTRLSIGTLYDAMTLNWYRDSTYLVGLSDSVIYASLPGNYSVNVMDPISHCSAVSAPHAIAVSSQVPQAGSIVNAASQHSLFINPFLPGCVADWYYDSVLVSGQDGQILPYLGDGTYQAVVYPAGFPQCSLTTSEFVLNSNVGIMEAVSDVYDLTVSPNPNNGTFAVRVSVLTRSDVTVSVTDMLGREVYTKSYADQLGEIKTNMDLTSLAKNIYTVQVSTANGKANRRVVIE